MIRMKLSYKLISFLLFIIGTNLPFLSRMQDLLSQGKYVSIIMYLGVWGICLIGLFSLLFHPKRWFRFSTAFLLVISTVLGCAFYAVSKHYIAYQDMELLWISRANTSDAVGFYASAAIVPVILSALFLVGIWFNETHEKLKKQGLLLGLISLLPFGVLSGVSFLKKGYGTEGMPQQYSSLATFFLYQAYDPFNPSIVDKREKLKIKPSQKSHFKNIFYIVDESIRSDYLDINYDRGVTPFLNSKKELLANFGKASSANNCSGFSNAILRMGPRRSKLTNVGTRPLIWQYAKEAGYRTIYVDAQQSSGTLQNFMSQDELKYIDDFYQFDDVPKTDVDLEIAHKLIGVINTNEKHFIYINKHGSHFPYSKTYKHEQEKFSPAMALVDKLGESKEKLVNSYKNSIYFNVDGFFKILFSKPLTDTFIMYTADHGQNLMDRGVMTHCNTSDPHPHEGNVPLFVYTENQEVMSKYKDAATKNYNKKSHFDIFPSLIQEMGYKRSDVLKEFDSDLLDSKATLQEFSAGSIIPRFDQEVKWYPIKL